MTLGAPDLFSEVQRYGISYLIGTPSSPSASMHLLPWQLLITLAQCEEEYLHHTVIALLLLHPEWTDEVEEALQRCPEDVKDELEGVILATCYLQQRWYLRLALALGEVPHLPTHPYVPLWERRHLPAPEVAFGESGLLALEIFERHRKGTIFDYRAAWDGPIHQLLWQETHQRATRLPVAAIVPLFLVPPNGVPTKSDQFSPVDRERIERFISRVTQQLSSPDQIYLGSETAAVLCGLHPTTEDMDIHIGSGEVLSPKMESVLREMRSSPETTWVADEIAYSIPIPSLWREQASHLASRGPLAVYRLSWATIAVAKMVFGTSWHLADVQTFLSRGWVSWPEIEQAIAEIVPQVYATPAYRHLDIEEFQQIYQAIVFLT